ncbi:MAG: OB-fold nucleic acid binding domain-containing protein [Desulfurococcales archaeon]|nr:OB-fold nucleic acid binding domain-containing protein [Desulfurococcales archaeon]
MDPKSNPNQISKIGDLKPGVENINIRGRIISVSPPKTIQTKGGLRTISEAVIGDETGRVKMTLWGKHAGSLKEGEAVEVRNAWTSAYRGEVQVNVSSKTELQVIGNDEAPPIDQIPEKFVKAPEDYRPPRTGGFRGGRGMRRGGFRRGGEE